MRSAGYAEENSEFSCSALETPLGRQALTCLPCRTHRNRLRPDYPGTTRRTTPRDRRQRDGALDPSLKIDAKLIRGTTENLPLRTLRSALRPLRRKRDACPDTGLPGCGPVNSPSQVSAMTYRDLRDSPPKPPATHPSTGNPATSGAGSHATHATSPPHRSDAASAPSARNAAAARSASTTGCP